MDKFYYMSERLYSIPRESNSNAKKQSGLMVVLRDETNLVIFPMKLNSSMYYWKMYNTFNLKQLKLFDFL